MNIHYLASESLSPRFHRLQMLHLDVGCTDADSSLRNRDRRRIHISVLAARLRQQFVPAAIDEQFIHEHFFDGAVLDRDLACRLRGFPCLEQGLWPDLAPSLLQ